MHRKRHALILEQSDWQPLSVIIPFMTDTIGTWFCRTYLKFESHLLKIVCKLFIVDVFHSRPSCVSRFIAIFLDYIFCLAIYDLADFGIFVANHLPRARLYCHRFSDDFCCHRPAIFLMSREFILLSGFCKYIFIFLLEKCLSVKNRRKPTFQ